MQPIRIGLLGAGAMGAEHAHCYGLIDGAEVAGIFSRDPARAARLVRESGARATADLSSQAAKSRPRRRVFAGGASATSAVATTGPTQGWSSGAWRSDRPWLWRRSRDRAPLALRPQSDVQGGRRS